MQTPGSHNHPFLAFVSAFLVRWTTPVQTIRPIAALLESILEKWLSSTKIQGPTRVPPFHPPQNSPTKIAGVFWCIWSLRLNHAPRNGLFFSQKSDGDRSKPGGIESIRQMCPKRRCLYSMSTPILQHLWHKQIPQKKMGIELHTHTWRMTRESITNHLFLFPLIHPLDTWDFLRGGFLDNSMSGDLSTLRGSFGVPGNPKRNREKLERCETGGGGMVTTLKHLSVQQFFLVGGDEDRIGKSIEHIYIYIASFWES